MKKGFLARDWFAGLVIVCVFLFFGQGQFLQGLERTAYDFGVRSSSRVVGDKVAVIAIDDQSIENIGRWPWPRSIQAQMIDKLRQGGAKVIGNTVFLLEPQENPGEEILAEVATLFGESSLYRDIPAEIERLYEMIDESAQVNVKTGGKSAPVEEAVELQRFFHESKLATIYLEELASFEEVFAAAAGGLSNDAVLAQIMGEAGNVVMAMPFVLGEPRGNPDAPLGDYVVRNALVNVVDLVGAEESGQVPISAIQAFPPLEDFGALASGIGHLNANPDVDGGIRSEPLVIQYYQEYYPSLSLMLAAKSLNLTPEEIEVRLGEGVKLGGLTIATDPHLQMFTYFYADQDGQPAFSEDSFFDVLVDKIPVEKYRDKIVLIGATAIGVGTPQVTPISPQMAPVLTLAHSVASILNEDFFVIPDWARYVEWGAFVLIALYLIALLPKLKAGMGAGLTAVLLIGLISTPIALLVVEAQWIQLMVPATMLLAGHLLLTTKRFLVTERGKVASDAQSAESNRNLGLMFQGKGELDMAFDAFLKCPMDDSIMDLLYNLALDFERKRQFNKAGAVYRHMADFNPKFRDLGSRMSRSKAMEDTVMLGNAGAGVQSSMLLEGGGVQKPMLGRYEVEKELGKGAMGIVYLGKDPKIKRVVAIKTMALSQEFEADELDDVKERFFREAETAGRLSHPNIVTVLDIGEEHDLAYIAMEFLKGKDLVPFTKRDALLPLKTVMQIVLESADALDFAHEQNVVHRDIKPANIMYEPESGKVKLTDFGIARITDSSKTKTGMVLGTPSYMSPEQLAGKHVDGRSDLFSLGVMLFQMSTGRLPFKGDSMATLMFQIANESHPDILTVNPNLPPCLKTIVDKALCKDVEQRYSRGREMVEDLRACMQSVA